MREKMEIEICMSNRKQRCRYQGISDPWSRERLGVATLNYKIIAPITGIVCSLPHISSKFPDLTPMESDMRSQAGDLVSILGEHIG
jgi:hypothetical protein